MISLASGTYVMPDGRTDCTANSTWTEPITVRAQQPGEALIQFGVGLVEGFYVSGSYWVFEDLVVEGTCANDSNCEHAFHVVGDADRASAGDHAK